MNTRIRTLLAGTAALAAVAAGSAMAVSPVHAAPVGNHSPCQTVAGNVVQAPCDLVILGVNAHFGRLAVTYSDANGRMTYKELGMTAPVWAPAS